MASVRPPPLPPGFTQLGSDSSKVEGKAIVANTKPLSAKDAAFLAAAEKVREGKAKAEEKSWEGWEPAVVKTRDEDPTYFGDFNGLLRNYRGDILNKNYEYVGTAYKQKSGGGGTRIRRTPMPDDLKDDNKDTQISQEEFNKIVSAEGYLRK